MQPLHNLASWLEGAKQIVKVILFQATTDYFMTKLVILSMRET